MAGIVAVRNFVVRAVITVVAAAVADAKQTDSKQLSKDDVGLLQIARWRDPGVLRAAGTG